MVERRERIIDRNALARKVAELLTNYGIEDVEVMDEWRFTTTKKIEVNVDGRKYLITVSDISK